MKSFIKQSHGAALIEFALVLPIILLLLLGMLELSRFAIIEMKLDKTASAMSDFVTQGNSVSAADLNGFANAIPQIMKPFHFSGSVIFSSISTTSVNGKGGGKHKDKWWRRRGDDDDGDREASANRIIWQYKALGSENSRLGNVGSVATLPGNYSVKSGQDLIAAEVYYHYAPLLPLTSGLISSLSPRMLYKISIAKPRQGALTTLQ